MTVRAIYCCGCGADVQARLTSGRETYPHRYDLRSLPFWKCDACGNFVGCHHKTSDRTRPLGVIPTDDIKKARSHIHRILDPLWQGKKINRKILYRTIADRIGVAEYHTAEIRSVEQAREVYRVVQEIGQTL